MFLSNPRPFFLLAIIFALILQACGSSQTNTNKQVVTGDDLKGRFPFSTTEPEVYQGDLVVTTGKSEEKWFVARNGDRWRIDLFAGNDKTQTVLKTDRLYSIDHRQKVYAANPTGEGGSSFNDLTLGFFRGTEYREFDDLGREGNLKKYKVRSADPAKGNIFIYIDEASGIMVRQEFIAANIGGNAATAKYVYEIRNLKLEADDSVFQIPSGYRKVTWDEFRTPVKQNK